MKDSIIRLIFTGDSARLDGTMRNSERQFRRFGNTVRREFDSIRNAARSVEGRLASLGLSFGALMLIKQSAQLDKGLTLIGQTAGESRLKVMGLRKELFRMAKETGQPIEELKAGVDNAVQAGLSFKEALPVMDAVNKGMAVSTAKADQLTSALAVAATQFDFDLTQPQLATRLLDKMVVAGGLGRAELDKLPDVFARIGANARRADFNYDKSLAFVEALSYAEPQAERLATLADSTLRIFTMGQYRLRAQAATGVRFFDKKGERRDPIEVLKDMKKAFDALGSAEKKEAFLTRAFGQVDQDTMKGLVTLFSGENLGRVEQFAKIISEASGEMDRRLSAATNNAVDQVGRLKGAMRQAADSFAQPFNRGISAGIKKLLDSKKEGGMELSGEAIAAGGATALLGGALAYRFSKGAAKKILGRLGRSTAAGIVEGKAIEAATGVTPVFVTNWPGSMGGIPEKTPEKVKDLAKKMLPWLTPAFMSGAMIGSIGLATGVAIVGNEINRRRLGDDKMIELLRDSYRRGGSSAAGAALQNEINISISGLNPPVKAETSDPNTRVTLRRGKF